jgi:hypothetical protein
MRTNAAKVLTPVVDGLRLGAMQEACRLAVCGAKLFKRMISGRRHYVLPETLFHP